MTVRPDRMQGASELADALARIDRAKEDYALLAHQIEEFLYEYMKSMVKGSDPQQVLSCSS